MTTAIGMPPPPPFDPSRVRVGVDFDNTIICYDGLFHAVAVEKGLVPAAIAPLKNSVRDYLRSVGNEDAWTELQGYVYGERICDAEAFAGVLCFFKACRCQGVDVFIISHKTRHPYRGAAYDLHGAAIRWLEYNGFLEPQGGVLPADRVFLEQTKADKLARIGRQRCTHFIDDLPEFLNEEGFPEFTAKILFDPGDHHGGTVAPIRFSSWPQIHRHLLGDANDGKGRCGQAS